MVLQTFWRSLRGSPQPFRKCWDASASTSRPPRGTHQKRAPKTPLEPPRCNQGAPKEKTQATSQKHPRNTPGTPQKHPKHSPSALSKHRWSTQWAPKEHPGTPRSIPGARRGAPREQPKNTPEVAQEHPRNGCHATSRYQPFLLLFNFYRTASCNLTTQTGHFTHVLNHSFYTCVKWHAVGCHDTPPVGANCWFYLRNTHSVNCHATSFYIST